MDESRALVLFCEMRAYWSMLAKIKVSAGPGSPGGQCVSCLRLKISKGQSRVHPMSLHPNLPASGCFLLLGTPVTLICKEWIYLGSQFWELQIQNQGGTSGEACASGKPAMMARISS